VKGGLLVGGAAVAILLPSSGSAQSPAPCEPGQAANVQVTTKDRVHGGQDAPLYATHEVVLSARVQADASNVQLTPRPGVRILKPGSNGRNLDLVIPPPPSLTVGVSWEQPVSPDPADNSRCSATSTLSFPVLKASPPTVKLIERRLPRSAQHTVTFVVKPARAGESLAPIELTLRRSAHAKLPSSHTKALRWSVPMRPGDRRHYARKLPAFTPFSSQGQLCRFWYLSCGAVFSQVDAERLHPLSFRQPSRWAAPFGILVATYPTGPSPRRFGFDIQARQDGRLIARYQRAGVCRDAPGSLGGVVNSCELLVVKSFSRPGPG
jgi:hypothetical protein